MPPAVLPGVRVRGVKPLEQLLVSIRISGGEVYGTGGESQFVIVHEIVAVMRELLISAVLAVARNGIREECPAELRLLQINGRRRRVSLPKDWRGSGLSEGTHSGGRHRRILRPDHLRITVIRQHVILVFAFPGID